MFFIPTILTPENENYPFSLKGAKEENLFPRIWSIGNLDILKRPLLGFFCSVKCPGSLILRTYDLARILRDAGAQVVSGFHSPIEKDCFDLLLKGAQPVVFCPARGIQNMRFPNSLKENIEKERVLVLSPFEGKVRRPTAQTAERRNQFVTALAAAVFVAHAEPGGMIADLCREIVSRDRPLYTFTSGYTENLIGLGARPVEVDRISEWATSAATIFAKSKKRRGS